MFLGEVTELFEIGEEVLVMRKKVFIGVGEVAAICRTLEELHAYFSPNHPLYASYQLSLQNEQMVYIVAFCHDLGQGGYLAHEIKKSRVKLYT